MNFLKSVLSQLSEFWKNTDSKTRTRIIISASLIIAITSLLTWFISRPEYVVLYSGLDSQEAGEIYALIENMRISPRAVGSGTIKVPKRNETEIRMQLAAEGHPKSGNTYDYFDMEIGLGATDFDKRMASQIQLQNRLEKTIETMEGVRNAIVTICIPEQNSFVLKEDKIEPTASVLLILEDSFLNSKQVRGIEQLVSKSVPGLKSENISIIDSNMNPLSLDDSDGIGNIGTQFDLELQLKKSLEKQVVSLLEPVFGRSHVMASVYVRLNFDKRITSKVEFNPVVDDEGIAISINELKESVVSDSGTTGNIAAGEAIQYPVSQGAGQGGYTNTNRSINYEVNETKEQIEEAQGRITELALSVLIDSSNLDSQTINTIQRVVSTALGVTSENVVVEGMSFTALAEERDKIKIAEEKADKELFKENIFDLGKKALVVILVFFVMFILFRFLKGIRLPAVNMDHEKSYEKILEGVVEMSELDHDKIAKKRKIDNIIDTKPDAVARQIKDWLNEN